jgi:hypothetical protein
MGFVCLRMAKESDEKGEGTMSSQSNIIRNLLKVIGFMAFIMLGANNVFSNNRINTGGQGAAIRVEQPTAIFDIGGQTTARNAPGSKSNKSSFTLTEAEPLLLLLFGLLLFSVATGIKLKFVKG